MSGPMVSRSQRRMEKRQALMVLVLLLAVALVSFVLGVMVGRGGGPMTARQPAPSRLPVASTPVARPAPESSEPARPAEDLTFYETLSQGDTPPLGSGINLPPQAPDPAPSAAPKAPAAPPEPVASTESAPRPAADAGGSFLVQAASFRDAAAAEGLQEKLADKGYPASVQKVDLGPKGTWYRVLAGSYASADQAERVVEELKRELRLTAMVRKR